MVRLLDIQSGYVVFWEAHFHSCIVTRVLLFIGVQTIHHYALLLRAMEQSVFGTLPSLSKSPSRDQMESSWNRTLDPVAV
jgi:hypothetical protein